MVGEYVRWYLRHLNRPDAQGVVGTVYDYDYDPLTCAGRPLACAKPSAIPTTTASCRPST